jgi:hypothetical protein
MRLMSASDDNLTIFFCDIPPMHLDPLIRERRFPRPYVLPRQSLGGLGGDDLHSSRCLESINYTK